MGDEIGIYSKLDRLPPTEKLGDSKKGMNRQDVPKKRKKKKEEESLPDFPQGEKKEEVDSSEKEPSGKIIDIII